MYKVKALSFLAIVLLLTTVPMTLLFMKQEQQIQQQAVGNTSYPANIEASDTYGQYAASDLTNPNIAAVDVKMDWADVEPQQDQFNWTPADNEIQAWVNHGKKFTLVIRYIHEPTGGVNCTGGSNTGQRLPAWEIARVPHFCNSSGAIVPDYFDKTFQSDLAAYVTAVAQHIAASPYKDKLLYVRIGVGFGGEGYPCLGCSNNDMTLLTNWGFSNAAWADWQEQMMGSFQTILQNAGLGKAALTFPLGYSPIDPRTNKPVDWEVADWAAAKGMGTAQEGLNEKPGYASGRIIQIDKEIRAKYPNAYIQFETVAPVGPNNAAAIQTDIQTANSAGAFSVAWYQVDSTNQAYQQYFASWQQMVDQRTANITITPNPSPTITPSLTPRSTITPGISQTPQPNSTTISITVCPHGLGNCGDNANPHGGNTNPLHLQRTVSVSFLDQNNQPASTEIGSLTYNQAEQNFSGTIEINNLTSGKYLVNLKLDGYLAKQVPGIQTITAGQTVTLPSVSVVTGDINNDNQLDIEDYNLLISCFGSKQTSPTCQAPPTSQFPGADLTDDGTVDGADYNLILREFSVQQGQGGSPLPSTTQPPQPSPTPTLSVQSTPIPTSPISGGLPGIHISGNKIVTDTGQQVILRGVNRGNGPEHACMTSNGINGPTDFASVQAMKAWKINIVRIPLNEDCWLGINGASFGGTAYQKLISDYVSLLNQNDIYALVDLHINAPGTQPATALEPMADADHALNFWKSVATTFKGNDRVIFDLFNEPKWNLPINCWLNGGSASACGTTYTIVGMQQMLDTIRATGATNIVLSGSVAVTNLPTLFQHKPTDPINNIMLGFHAYGNNFNCNTSCLNNTIAQVMAQIPVYVGEIGESYDATLCTTTFLSTMIPFLDTHQGNYSVWTWNPGSGCGDNALVTDWSGTPLSPHGTWYKQYLSTIWKNYPYN